MAKNRVKVVKLTPRKGTLLGEVAQILKDVPPKAQQAPEEDQYDLAREREIDMREIQRQPD